MLYWADKTRLLHADSEEDWEQLPFLINNYGSRRGDKTYITIGEDGKDGYCYIDKPEKFPCNIYIEGFGNNCHARIISDIAATACLNQCIGKALDQVKTLQSQISYCLAFERRVLGTSVPFYPDDYEPNDDTEE